MDKNSIAATTAAVMLIGSSIYLNESTPTETLSNPPVVEVQQAAPEEYSPPKVVTTEEYKPDVPVPEEPIPPVESQGTLAETPPAPDVTPAPEPAPVPEVKEEPQVKVTAAPKKSRTTKKPVKVKSTPKVKPYPDCDIFNPITYMDRNRVIIPEGYAAEYNRR